MKLLTKAQTVELINDGFYLVKFRCLYSCYMLRNDENNVFGVKTIVGRSLEKKLFFVGIKKTPAYIEELYAKKQG